MVWTQESYHKVKYDRPGECSPEKDCLRWHWLTFRQPERKSSSERRALLVCNSHDSLADERKYLDNVFSKNNYNRDFVTRNTYRTEPNETNTNLTPNTTVTIPYIKGTSEIIARILQPYNIRVAHRPITTLRKLLTNVKDKDQPRDRQGAVYKIKCCDCQATYIGETGRNLNTRLTEHRRATRNGDINNNIAEHHLQTNHRIDWDSATCVTYNTNYYQRIVLESWFTNLEQTPINRCLQLPAPYKRLIDDINRQTTHWFYSHSTAQRILRYTYWPKTCRRIETHQSLFSLSSQLHLGSTDSRPITSRISWPITSRPEFL